MPKRKVQAEVTTYSAAISACEKAWKWPYTLVLLQDMLDSGSVPPNVISYNSALSACQKAHQWPEALSLFVAMQEQTVRPDVTSYHAAITACEKGGHCCKASEFFEAMFISVINVALGMKCQRVHCRVAGVNTSLQA